MKYFLKSAQGRRFEVEVQEISADHYCVTVEGREVEADFFDVDGSGQYAASIQGRSFAASIEQSDEQHLRVTIAGETFSMLAEDEREQAAGVLASSRPKAEVIKATMPGVVIAVPVSVGDRMEPGQAVLVLEAMKMQNEMATQEGGIVKEVLAAEGDTVSANAVLIRLEPLPEN
tara:strand:- start:40 stop:561 length:522 start_codon:yes stop_codon:yes gene_type:complete